MRKVILQLVKATFAIIAGFSTLINPAFSQQGKSKLEVERYEKDDE